MSQFLKIKTSPALPPYYSLKSTGICSTSHWKYCPRGPPQATHASAWRKWEKWVPKLIRMIGFRQNFDFFPEAPGWPGWVFYDVFWCSGALGTFLEWSWMNSGNFIFSWFFSKFWPQNVDFVCSRSQARFICDKSLINLFYTWSIDGRSQYIF